MEYCNNSLSSSIKSTVDSNKDTVACIFISTIVETPLGSWKCSWQSAVLHTYGLNSTTLHIPPVVMVCMSWYHHLFCFKPCNYLSLSTPCTSHISSSRSQFACTCSRHCISLTGCDYSAYTLSSAAVSNVSLSLLTPAINASAGHWKNMASSSSLISSYQKQYSLRQMSIWNRYIHC